MKNIKIAEMEIPSDYFSLSKEDKEEYLLLVEGLKPEELSSGDIIILNLFSKKKNLDNFFSIDKY